MSVRVDLQGISAGSFIDRRGALGVTTGQYALLEYRTAGFSPQSTKGFCLNSAIGLPNRGSSVDFTLRGICSHAFGSRQFPDTFKEKTRITGVNTKESSQYKHGIQMFLFIADDQTSLIQSSRKACSVQIGDE
jgi:hypothetical protein